MGCDELNCDLLKCCVVFFLSTRQVGEEEVRSCFALKIFQGRRGRGGGSGKWWHLNDFSIFFDVPSVKIQETTQPNV